MTIKDKEGSLLSDKDQVYDVDQGMTAIFRQNQTDCWLEWEDLFISWLIDPSRLLKMTEEIRQQLLSQ